MAEESVYGKLGIDAGKTSVKKAFSPVIDNDYLGAFVNIINDPENPGQVLTQHMDGDGSKLVQRILFYMETGDITVVRGAVDDALQMNLGDIAASGFVFGRIMFSDVININKANVPKDEIMEQMAIRFHELKLLYREYGFNLFFFLGGETAELPDQVDNIVFDVAVNASAKKSDIITGNVVPSDKIYGLASDGQAIWEKEIITEIMSNGLTLGRIYGMWSGYTEKYPHLIGRDRSYQGKYKVGEYAEGLSSMPLSDALISPTRQWAIFIRLLIEKLKQHDIQHMLHGISMNTGGGATKIGNVGKDILYIKEMPVPPPLCQVLQRESGESWRNMFHDLNCGVGLDVVGEDNQIFEAVLRDVAYETNIAMYDLGHCDINPRKGNDRGNKVVLITPYGTFDDYE